MILKLFSSGPEHPLADPKALKNILAELPADDAFKAIDEIVGWLESLEHPEGLRADKVCEVVRALDEAAQPHMRRLTRAYLTTPRLTKLDERRYWTTSLNFWRQLVRLYEAALGAAGQRDKAGDALKPVLPLIVVRLLSAYGGQLKWTHFRYGRLPAEFWRGAGATYLRAEQLKVAEKALQCYPGQAAAVTPAQAYLKLLLLASSSLDSLLPLEIELAERLLDRFVPQFVLSTGSRPDSLYWVDPALDHGPARLACKPPATPGVRFVALGQATAAVAEATQSVERGDIPESLALGGKFSLRVVLSTLHHLAAYWAPQPPMRQHQRHPVKSRLFVQHGFETCAAVLGGQADRACEQAESWVVENVSLGGFGAVLKNQRDDWLCIGALLCLQPEGGENWLLGVVRRYAKDGDMQAGVGIETMARQPAIIELRPCSGSGQGSALAFRALCFQAAADSADLSLVLPRNTFDARESYAAQVEGKLSLLVPVELCETGPDYELARYRIRFLET